MKNLTYFLLTLLTCAPAYAAKINFEDAQRKVSSCQERVEQLKAQLNQRERRIKTLQARLSKISGNPDYAKDIEKHNEAIRRTTGEHGALLTQHNSALNDLTRAISDVGRKYYVNGGGEQGKYHVMARGEAHPPKAPAK